MREASDVNLGSVEVTSEANLKDQAKAIPIIEVAEKLRVESGGRLDLRKHGNAWVARCLEIGHEDREPSLRLRVESNSWHCFSCGDGGDSIALVAKAFGWDTRTAQGFKAALGWLKDQFNLSGSLRGQGDAAVERWARARGLNAASVAAFEPQPREEYGHEVLAFPRRERPGGPPVAYQKRRADNGAITAGRRSISEGPMAGLHLPCPWPTPNKYSVLVICEGEADAVACHTAGFTWVAGTPGKNWPIPMVSALEELVRPFERVVLIMDGDVPDHGKTGLFARAAVLGEQVIPARVPPWVSGKCGGRDVNEWVRQAGASAVSEAIGAEIRGTVPFTALRCDALSNIRRAVETYGGGLQSRHWALIDSLVLHLLQKVLPFQTRRIRISPHKTVQVGPGQWLTSLGKLREQTGANSTRPIRTCLEKLRLAGILTWERAPKRGMVITIHALSQYIRMTRKMQRQNRPSEHLEGPERVAAGVGEDAN